jgi:hypothetical protein
LSFPSIKSECFLEFAPPLFRLVKKKKKKRQERSSSVLKTMGGGGRDGTADCSGR